MRWFLVHFQRLEERGVAQCASIGLNPEAGSSANASARRRKAAAIVSFPGFWCSTAVVLRISI